LKFEDRVERHRLEGVSADVNTPLRSPQGENPRLAKEVEVKMELNGRGFK
jgi:hypothetical protein